MSSTTGGELPAQRMARVAGGFFVAFIVASVLASRVGSIGLSDEADLYRSVTTSATSFRLGLVCALASGLLFLVAAWALYVLLRPVQPQLALLFLVLNAVGVAVQCASMLPLIAVLLQSDPDSAMRVFAPEQLTALAYLSIGVYKTGFVTAQLFFSTWLFPLGYLVYRCGFLPRVLGVLLLLDGVADLFWFVQGLLLPDRSALSRPAWVISFVAEVSLALWLLVKGVQVPDATEEPPVGKQPAHRGSGGSSLT